MSNILKPDRPADKIVLTLVMPVHQEGEAVIPVIATLFLTVRYPFKLIVVYDSEDDTTVATIKKLQKYFNNIYLVQNEWGKGVLNAIKTGFRHADTPYVGIWTAYHVDPFGIVNEMVEKLEQGYDMVSATRFTTDVRARGNIFKKILSFWGNTILNKIIGLPISDTTTAWKVYKKSLLDSIPLETSVNGGWAFILEITIKAAIKGYRLANVPLESKNLNIIHGTTNFKVLKQLPEYLRWVLFGWKNRKLIKKHLGVS